MTDYENMMAIVDELKSTVKELARLNIVLREIKAVLEDLLTVAEEAKP